MAATQRARIGIAVGTLTLAMGSVAAAVEMKPGRWEVTSIGHLEGVGEMPPQTKEMCLGPDGLVPHAKANDTCTVSGVEVKGDVVSWNVTCEDAASGAHGQGAGSVTYAGETFDGELTMTLTPAGQPAVTMQARLEGKRIGECQE